MTTTKLKELLFLVDIKDNFFLIKKDKVKLKAWTKLFEFYNKDLAYPLKMDNAFNYARVYMKALNYIYDKEGDIVSITV